MKKLRYAFRSDWVFYLFLMGYFYLVFNMTAKLWLGDGINIFERYSEATTSADMLIDANKVYWSKTCFLFLTLFLFALNFDYRFAVGVAASFWSVSLIVIFGSSPILLLVVLLGAALVLQQILRKQVFSSSRA